MSSAAESQPIDLQPVRWIFTAGAVHGSALDPELTLCGLEVERQTEVVADVAPPVCDVCNCVLGISRSMDGVKIEGLAIHALDADGVVHVIRDGAGDPTTPWLACRDAVVEIHLVLRVDTADGARFFNFDALPLKPARCSDCANIQRAKTLGERLMVWAWSAEDVVTLRHHFEADTMPESKEGRLGAVAMTLEALGTLRAYVEAGFYSREAFDVVVEKVFKPDPDPG